MGLLSWIIIGLIVGLIVRCFFPVQSGGLPANLLLTMIGALTGGYISCYFDYGTLAVMDTQAMLAALVGALIMALLLKILRF